MTHSKAEQATLQIIQEVVKLLAIWTGSKKAHELIESIEADENESDIIKAVERAKILLSWNSKIEPEVLHSLFDSVRLLNCETGNIRSKYPTNYWYPQFIENEKINYPRIPYPQVEKPAKNDFDKLKSEIKNVLDELDNEDFKNLSLLTIILEKYCSFISFGDADVALVDIAKSTAAVAAVLANNPEAQELGLIAGDLSGIQNFIYTISSDGALKSLRARSFYLELVTEEVVQQILEELQLPRTNVIYAGGGNLYILVSATSSVKNSIEEIRQQFNKCLLDKFQGKVFLALDCKTFDIQHIATETFAKHWSDITKDLAKQKSRKFAENITEFTQVRESHEPCKVCHRDDVEKEKLKPLNSNEPDSVLACDTCCEMFDLGGKLLRVDSIVRSHTDNLVNNNIPKLSFELPDIGKRKAINVYYYLFETWKTIVQNPENVLLVNDWTIEHYQFRNFKNPIPLLLGNYGKATENSEESGFIRANEMVEKAKGIDRVGYLRMDVDNLGKIFAEGLDDKKTLPRIAGLSRQMSYFFKVYLNSLAESRNANVPRNVKQLTPEDERLNLLFIYAGGDDLFVSGAWNEVVEFAFDVYQSFRGYTGNNPDITLSGGISIADAKFPLYQAAKTSGNAEDKAKNNGRDSLGLFGEVFKWDEWLGIKNNNKINISDEEKDIKIYLSAREEPILLGILPFVEILATQKIGLNYSRNFVRNLLSTAQIQEEALKKIEEQHIYEDENRKDKIRGIRYFLHLPKIAYTLSRLPNGVLKDEDFRKSLKSPYNAPYFRAIATWIELLNRS